MLAVVVVVVVVVFLLCFVILRKVFMFFFMFVFIWQDVIYWVESNEMEKDALISIPKSMEEMLGSTDWIEVQTLLDTKTMSEYENWRKDDDNFEW